jgi:protease-4
MIQLTVEDVYDTFITHVSEGRNLSKEKIDSIGQGRIWTGADAKKIGLVDVIGGLQTTIDLAAKKAKLTEYGIKTYPEKDKLTMIIEGLFSDTKSYIVKEALGETAYSYFLKIKELRKVNGIQARIPFYIDIE